MRELMARVKARLRLVRLIREEIENQVGSPPVDRQVIQFDNLSIDLTRREIRLNDQVVPLKPKEFDLLVFLAQHPGQVLSREYVLEKVWGWDYIGDSRTVDVHIRWLREKIEPDPAVPRRILTVRGAGYRFDG
jgi:DNA-binding response OmpR family regulator